MLNIQKKKKCKFQFVQRKEGWFTTFDLDNTDIVSSVQYCSTNIFKEISDMNETNFVD